MLSWSHQKFKADKLILKNYILCMGADIFDFNALRFGRLVADWSVENMTPDMTPC